MKVTIRYLGYDIAFPDIQHAADWMCEFWYSAGGFE